MKGVALAQNALAFQNASAELPSLEAMGWTQMRKVTSFGASALARWQNRTEGDGGGMATEMGMTQRHPEMKANLNVDSQIDRGALARVAWVTGDKYHTRSSDIVILLTPLRRDGVKAYHVFLKAATGGPWPRTDARPPLASAQVEGMDQPW